ncbi:hypothetical protein BDA99DRAFT_497332 [Phascolomyces articulosus]|uniref:MutL C-terminal dimerisation domain-containing protein n=1 Tax=Phascolomyces articulosus TaxID=60185 RepID=A0AAD5KKL0_9FUNG|nr:hypothetical protein BDA99DRAFT_497332 [Phascolomyces articulosus]
MAQIVELQPQVIHQLRASLNITTLQQCIEELVKNALDADATQVDISFDAEKYTVRVDDDGIGINPTQLTHLCKRHATSKCKTLNDLRHVHTFGYRGQGLASLADIGIVQIISRFHQCDYASMGIWKDGKLIETSSSQPRRAGTTVIIRDLFYKFPVRRRFYSNTTVERTNEYIKRWVITIALAFPHIGFILRDRGTKILVTKKRSSDLNLLNHLYGHEFIKNIRSFEYNDDTDIKLQGHFGIIPYPSKNQQFIYINRHPIEPNHSLYRTVIETFVGSSIMTEQSKKGKGVVEKHPVFVIHIEDLYLSSYDIALYLLDEHKVYPNLRILVRQLVANFLRAYNFISSTAYKQLVDISDSSNKRKKTSALSSSSSSANKVTWPSSWLYSNNSTTEEQNQPGAINFIDRSKLRKKFSPIYQQTSTPSSSTETVATKAVEDTKKASLSGIMATNNNAPTTTTQHEGLAVRLEKESLKDAKVLAQVDNKFILIKLLNAGHRHQLLLVDQHAADERVQLERMLWSLKDTAEATQLDPSITIDLTPAECILAQKYAMQLSRWGFRLSITTPRSDVTPTPLSSIYQEASDSTTTTILRYSKHFSTRQSSPHFKKMKKATTVPSAFVTRLPRIIADRCIVNNDMLCDLLREYLHSLDRVQQNQQDEESENDQEVNSFTFLHGCPRGMMNILRSKACRGAIMFNDSLTLDQCRWLIKALSDCRFPFQCVHGRPSIVPLVALDRNRPKRHKINWSRFYI